MTDSDSEDEKFPTHIAKSQASVSRSQLLNIVCHNLLKLLKLFTAISLTVLLSLEDDCGSLMMPLLVLIAFILYSDVILFAMVPIAFNHFNQACARRFYSVYKVLKWFLRFSLIALGICYNIFVFSSKNKCTLGQSTDGSILLTILIAIDFCLAVYCCFGSAIVCGFGVTWLQSRES